ncbi:MAG: PaaI family thioesterase [Anaerolineae bacterium]|nr:PaaI family thioesterase [Anaerolineae bacterium]
MQSIAFQDEIQHNHCYGCGPVNQNGLQIKSYWSEDGEQAICDWQPKDFHLAGPAQILNGGIIATIFDCHCVCTAIAAAYRAEGRSIASLPDIWYATGSIQVKYLRPTPIAYPVTLHARIKAATQKQTILTASLYSQGQENAVAEVLAVRVPDTWGN